MLVVVSAVLVLLAVLVATPSPRSGRLHPGSLRPGRLRPGRLRAAGQAVTPRRDRGPTTLTAADVGLTADHVATLAVAGLPPPRIWAAVAEHGPTPAVRALARAVSVGQRRGTGSAAALRDHLGAGAGAGSGAGSGSGSRPVRAWAGRPADPGAAQLAVALDLSERTGAGLAETLRRFAEASRADQCTAEARAAALAGPQATAAVLGLLPLAGLALGAAVGARPWHALLGTAPGRACLVVGSGLWLGGRLWTGALVRRAAASADGGRG